jgi:hypothetical protein
VAILAWGSILLSTGRNFALAGVGVMIAGAVVFLIRARRRGEWPFAEQIPLRREDTKKH